MAASPKTPEAEPEQAKAPQEQKPAPPAEPKKREGGDGSAVAPISDAQKKQIIDQYLRAQQPQQPSEAADIPESIWSISRNYVRGPLGKLLLTGAVLANPIAAGTVYFGDKILRNTVGKVPGIGQLYEKPRQMAIGAATTARNAIAATVTAPTIAIDVAENVYEGITGTERTEAKGVIGRTVEWTTEKAGQVLGKGLSILKWGKDQLEKIPFRSGAERLGKIAAAPVTLPISLTKGAYSVIAPRTNGIIGSVASLGLTAAALYGAYWVGSTLVLPALGPGAQLALNQLWHGITGFFR